MRNILLIRKHDSMVFRYYKHEVAQSGHIYAVFTL